MAKSPKAYEVLARRLDKALPPGEQSIPARTNDPLVNAALMLARSRPPDLSPAAAYKIEMQLRAAHQRRAVRARSARGRGALAFARWLAAACVLIALVVAGLTPAAASSLPGEPLYIVKQALEKVELALAQTPAQRARVYVRQARRRLDEGEILLERGQFNPSLVYSALNGLTQAADQARASGDAALLAALREQTTALTVELNGLLLIARAQGAQGVEQVAPAATALQASRDDGELLLPPTTMPTPVPTLTPVPDVPLIFQNTGASNGNSQACADGGNSCNSAGVPGGQIIPANPPGQSNGRSDAPPVPPGAGIPGGGQPVSPGNSGSASGQLANPTNGNANGSTPDTSNSNGNANGSENTSSNGNANGSPAANSNRDSDESASEGSTSNNDDSGGDNRRDQDQVNAPDGDNRDDSGQNAGAGRAGRRNR